MKHWRWGYLSAGVGILFFTRTTLAVSLEDNLATQERLGIPPTIAVVQDCSLRSRSKLPEFILIQDIHRHPEVQGHIAALLLHGIRNWGVKDVYLEGAWSETVTLPNSLRRNESLMEGIREGRICGVEMAARMVPKDKIHFHGLEDPDVYRDNVAAYQAAQTARELALRELGTARLIHAAFDATDGHWNDEDWERMRALLQLRLKPSDYQTYLERRRTWNSRAALSEGIRAAETFYELADARNRIFAKRVLKNKNHKPKILVIGGFHAAGVVRLLSEEKKSYVVISPKVTQSGDDSLYARGMQETISALKLHPGE